LENASALAFCATGAANKEDEDPQANANIASPAKPLLIESILYEGENMRRTTIARCMVNHYYRIGYRHGLAINRAECAN
jgi:hypothetical protein